MSDPHDWRSWAQIQETDLVCFGEDQVMREPLNNYPCTYPDGADCILRAAFKRELAATKLAAVEAFYAAVQKRDDALIRDVRERHPYDHLRVALDAELAKWREEQS